MSHLGGWRLRSEVVRAASWQDCETFMASNHIKSSFHCSALHLALMLPQDSIDRTSQVVQWLGIHLPTQRTQVLSLAQEDPTLQGN